MPKPVLIVAYDFPPFVGGGGSIRMVKLAKYLRQLGHDVVVLTGGFETRDADPTVLQELEGIPIRVANTRPVAPSVRDPANRSWPLRMAGRVIRSVIPFPDNRFRYLGALFREARAILGETGIRTVLITSPPNSMGLLAVLLRRWDRRLTLVLDYRDMWALDPLMAPDTRYFRWVQRHLEKWTLGHTDHVVSVTPGFNEWIQRQTGRLEACSVITNGYDEEDFLHLAPLPDPGPLFVITYAGSIGGVNGPRSLAPTLQALEKLEGRRPDLRGKVVLQVAGHVAANQLSPLRQHLDEGRLRLLGYLPHQEALHVQRQSDAILILLFDKPHLDLVYPGKMFEACRLGRPLAAFSPKGLLTSFVLERDLGEAAGISSVEEQSAALERLVDRCRSGPAYDLPCRDLETFERGRLARRYSELLEGLPERP